MKCVVKESWSNKVFKIKISLIYQSSKYSSQQSLIPSLAHHHLQHIS